jgi:uncharacterized membrane protein YkvA (DUF1232 family)
MSSFLQRLRYYFLILSDRQTPWYLKLILTAALLYILFPMDFLADTVPLIGWLDDLAVASFVIALAIRQAPKEVVDRIRKKVFGSG